jgi:STELLO glycosyltransferases
MMQNTSLVITSISAPNEAMKAFAAGCASNGIEFIVIGDTKSPGNFQLDGCRFAGIEEQRSMPYKIAKLLPEKHYGRKNLGYLLSKNKDVIIETDDDNLPRAEFWKKNLSPDTARFTDKKGWVNAYRYFSDENIWPRGLPLEELQGNGNMHEEVPSISIKADSIKILQGLADENPDVDAVYRMTMKLPTSFEKRPPLLLGSGSWCPFNSQNTVWKKEAFALMYLPSYCSFRMTDIWRSFVAQRIAWTCGWNILFHSADVWQERNEHNLLKDFADEVPGYLNNFRMCKMLEELDLKTGNQHLTENLLRCYKLLVESGWVGKEEMAIVEAWCGEF